ncbi:DEAD/DEAH box helicase [Aquirufa sp. HETE-83D]|uniref:DEAD/DEAH box helicase n=1 Tax=Aquirufa esocilacus TaxID=3096513 RepID=A0ABW6DKK5_9BACT
MNFKSFYSKTEQRIIDTALSLWATGDVAMQAYLKEIFSSEKLLAKPVFQNMFPWEPETFSFGELNDLFQQSFIDRLDRIQDPEFRFPADRPPYLHQVNSWKKTLRDNKSILVTTGTGSGKTECFMLPVLQDIYRNSPNKHGVNAIFLYPLNALIGSQRKRMHAWCSALGNINYAIYNGNTKNNNLVNNKIKQNALPEYITREDIRQTPPQILFTNPTMLEYMLVRDKDSELLQNSQGTLRWILLDEAHTLTGSKAAEMALLIRRVIDAFGVDQKDIRFAVTSATVGDGNDEALKQFMADLCGISSESIEIIKGKRTLPEFNEELINDQPISPQKILELRNAIYSQSSLDSDSIARLLEIPDVNEQLNCIDKLAEITDNGQPVLPVRGHFFARNISGIFSCSNPNCQIHNNIPTNLFSSVTTITKRNCECGYPLLELISCKSCGSYMLEGEIENRKIRLSKSQNTLFFEVDDRDAEEDENDNNENPDRFVLAKKLPNREFITEDLSPVEIGIDGVVSNNDNSELFQLDDHTHCPYCKDNISKPFHFRMSSTFLNRLMSDVVLEQTDKAQPRTDEMLWDGKKYISFTDSRSGTAKISALINIDNETYWLRSFIYHNLSRKIKENRPLTLTLAQRAEMENALVGLQNRIGAEEIPFMIDILNQQIVQIEAQLNNELPNVNLSRISWREILQNPGIDFEKLFNNIIGGNYDTQGSDYLNALLFNEFAKRWPRDRSLENLGLVKVVYPDLEMISRPDSIIELNITEIEWKVLVKIALDFEIRNKFQYSIPQNVRSMASKKHKTFTVYPSSSNLESVQKWPKFNRNHSRPNRLALLICAGLGYNNRAQITPIQEDQVNEVLGELWNTLRTYFLSADGIDGGYKLNLVEKAGFELTDKLWLCPVKKRLLDTMFRGYSPWIKGSLSPSNIESYKVGNEIHFPLFPYPFNLDQDNIANPALTELWLNENEEIITFKENGLWNSLYERIINFKPLYLAGEHSAQQQTVRLLKLEDDFQKGKINILSCSTTMEMGVDIGGISAVVMSNVPPSPANYLQRTGRAGRRRENKSLAFTICAANPIGVNVINNPAWALNHTILPPMLAFSSKSVVYRHLNAFMLGKFIQQRFQGINVQEKISAFFIDPLPGSEQTAADSFASWIAEVDVASLNTTIKKIILNTPLSNTLSFTIVNSVYTNFSKIVNNLNAKKENFDLALSGFLATDYTEDSPAYKAVNFQKNQFLNKNLLAYLSEEGFLPAGGIPTGIVDFNNISYDDLGTNPNNRQLPTYHITRALSEFAPGNELVIDGWTYKSAGISLKNIWGGEASKRVIQHCSSCGYEHIIEANDALQTICPHCNRHTLAGILRENVFTEIIEPVGFAVDLYASRSREINENTNVQYVEPLLIGVEPWSDPAHPVFDFRDSKENAEILYYNYGKKAGYAVCLECGRADTNPEVLKNHKRLRGGRDQNNPVCGGSDNPFAIRENVLLVGRFSTDFFEFRCKDINGGLIQDEITLYSLGQIISKSLTVLLGIEEQEVGFGIKKYGEFSSVFLFDTAKGGAGYVSQCANYFDQVCRIALTSLTNCTCHSACTRCLIDRNSQFNIDNLNRFSAIDWLKRVVDLKVPEEIALILTHNPKKLLNTIRFDWAKMLQKKQLQEVWMLVDFDQIDNWEDDNFLLLSQLKLNDVEINLVFRGEPVNLSLDQKLTLVQTKSWATLHYVTEFTFDSLEWIGRVSLTGGQLFDYFGNDYHTIVDNSWGNSADNYIYRQDGDLTSFELVLYDVVIEENQANVFEVFIPTLDRFIQSDSIFNQFFDCLDADVKISLSNKFSDKNIKVVYSDRYLTSPFGCLLLVQFIHKIELDLNCHISELTVQLKGLQTGGISGNSIVDKFVTEESRKEFIKRIANETGILEVSVEISHDAPHYRFMSFDFESESSVTIRPDAGIEHGWFAQDKNRETNSIHGFNNIAIRQNLNKNLLYSLVFNR